MAWFIALCKLIDELRITLYFRARGQINEMDSRENQLLTPAAAAHYLNISMRTLKNYREQGLPHIRYTPRTIRYRIEDLRDFQNRHYQKNFSLL